MINSDERSPKGVFNRARNELGGGEKTADPVQGQQQQQQRQPYCEIKEKQQQQQQPQM